MQDIVNSKKVNETLLKNVNEMFELEFDIKMKAQLLYMESKQRRGDRKGFLSAMRHEYLWTPSTIFYAGSVIMFFLMRKKYKWETLHIIPFMMIPVTMDYVKREWYVQQVDFKDRKELA